MRRRAASSSTTSTPYATTRRSPTSPERKPATTPFTPGAPGPAANVIRSTGAGTPRSRTARWPAHCGEASLWACAGSPSGVTLSGVSLSLSFNHGGFRGGHKARCEIPPLAFLLSSSGFLERRVTLRPAREAPFGPTRRPPAGFRSLRRGAHRRQECRETPKRPAWRQPPVSLRALPWQAAVLRARAGLPQLGVGQEH